MAGPQAETRRRAGGVGMERGPPQGEQWRGGGHTKARLGLGKSLQASESSIPQPAEPAEEPSSYANF